MNKTERRALVTPMISFAQIPAVWFPLPNCCYCWYVANGNTPFPAYWSSTICDEHLALYFPGSRVVQHSCIDRRLPIERPMLLSELLTSLADLPTLADLEVL